MKGVLFSLPLNTEMGHLKVPAMATSASTVVKRLIVSYVESWIIKCSAFRTIKVLKIPFLNDLKAIAKISSPGS